MPKQDTATKILEAARDCLLADGYAAMSTRKVAEQAGVPLSQIHYHFGSKDALVAAVYEYRMERVNQRRLEMLAQIDASQNQNDVRTIVAAIVQPIADEIRDSAGGSHYIRFMAQLIGHPRVSLLDLWNSRFGAGLSQVIALLRAALPEVPPMIIGQRFGLMWEQVIHALADRERLSAGGESTRMVDPDLFVSNLIDTVAGGLSAPLSTDTRAALQDPD